MTKYIPERAGQKRAVTTLHFPDAGQCGMFAGSRQHDKARVDSITPESRPARGSRHRAPSRFSWGARVNGAWCSAAPIPATWPSGAGNGRQAPRLQRERRKQQNNPNVGRVVVVGSQPSRSQAATTLSYDGKAPRPAYPLSVSHVRRLSRKPRSARHRASRASRSSTVSTPRDT